MVIDVATLTGPFATVAATIFIAELTDKDALLLLTLATRTKFLTSFLAGATAFIISTTIIVTVGYFLVSVIPVFWIRLAGGIIMIAYGLWQYFSTGTKSEEEERLVKQTRKKSALSIFLGAISLLILLDLAGDATEVLTIVFVSRYPAFLVFTGAVTALVTAAAVETALGGTLKRYLSAKRLRLVSLIVLLIIGSLIIVTDF